MEHDVVYTEKAGPVGVIFLNQPAKKNAVSAVMMDLLSDALEMFEEDEEIKAVVLRGTGEHFCAGGDLDQPGPKPMTAEFSRKSLRRYTRAVRTIRSVSKPVIAMAGGYTVGGGVSLMLACDLVCVSAGAKIFPNFCKIGLVPELGVMATLPALIGPQKAKELLFFGDRMSGEEWYALGLANRVFPAEDLEEGTMDFARRVAELPALSLQLTKGIMNSTSDGPLLAVLEAESVASPFCSQGAAFKAVAAKFAKG